MQTECAVSEHGKIAQLLLRISPELNQIVQDQLALVEYFNGSHLFKIEQEARCIRIASPLFMIQFHCPEPMAQLASKPLAHGYFEYMGQKAEGLEEFFLDEVHFLTGDLKAQHPLFLRSKAQQLRTLIIQQIYLWGDVAQRVQRVLHHLDLAQAQLIDQLMMDAHVYDRQVMQNLVLYQHSMPIAVLHLFQHLFRLDSVFGQEVLPLQPLMESYDDLCFSAAQFLDPAIYRIMSLSFKEQFNLNQLIEHEDDIRLLYQHAQEQPHLLGFARLMNREIWQRSNLLSKQHFLTTSYGVWQKKVAVLPLFDATRTVNWLFKQSAEVLDWVSQNIQHSNIRTAVTALSFMDTSQVHPQVVLATLQYFQHISARLFIQSCHYLAVQDKWFDHPQNNAVVLQGTRQAIDDHRVAIRPSILYLDEWMALTRCIASSDQMVFKKVYLNLSRVMQAFMQHLQKNTADFPLDVMAYILPERQQDRDFYTVLQRHRIQLDVFRRQFYLRFRAVRKTVFDAYVRDYLSAYFSENKTVPKTVTWTGLFHQAVAWHEQIQKEEILSKLTKDFSLVTWQPICEHPRIEFGQWVFEELQSIEQIIDESRKLQHCLASSYAQRIIEGGYVAFQMQHTQLRQRMTLGCIRQQDTQHHHLLFDQLELPNNEKADDASRQVAQRFIDWLNKMNSHEINKFDPLLLD